MTFRPLADDGDLSDEIAAAAPWVHAAGQPYVDWLLGGPATARRILEQWMRRRSSEVYIGRAVIAEEGARPVGGFIALSGAELARCRVQDAVAAARAVSPDQRSSLLARLRLARELFGEVLADDLYLSRMGVLPELRRRGYGRAIVRECLRQGTRRGFGRVALDVASANDAAIELYRSVGFVPERGRHVRGVAMTYLRMTLELSRPVSRGSRSAVSPRRAHAARTQ